MQRTTPIFHSTHAPALSRKLWSYSKNIQIRSLRLRLALWNQQTLVQQSQEAMVFLLPTALYHAHLVKNACIPLDKTHIDLLNSSWDQRPHQKIACLQLHTGAIITTGQHAMIIGCIKAYSWLKYLDTHHKKSALHVRNSIPSLDSQYSDLAIVKVQHDSSTSFWLEPKYPAFSHHFFHPYWQRLCST